MRDFACRYLAVEDIWIPLGENGGGLQEIFDPLVLIQPGEHGHQRSLGRQAEGSAHRAVARSPAEPRHIHSVPDHGDLLRRVALALEPPPHRLGIHQDAICEPAGEPHKNDNQGDGIKAP